MSKIQLQIIRGVGLAMALVLVLFILPASNASAETGLSVGNAVKHAGSVVHTLSLNSDTLKHVKQLVIVPEPGTNALMVAGGIVGLVAWRLRKRSHRNSVSS